MMTGNYVINKGLASGYSDCQKLVGVNVKYHEPSSAVAQE